MGALNIAEHAWQLEAALDSIKGVLNPNAELTKEQRITAACTAGCIFRKLGFENAGDIAYLMMHQVEEHWKDAPSDAS